MYIACVNKRHIAALFYWVYWTNARILEMKMKVNTGQFNFILSNNNYFSVNKINTILKYL